MYVSKRVCNNAIKNVFIIFLFALIRTSFDFSFFLFVCLWISVPLSSCIKLWLIVSAYTSLLRVSYSFSLNIRISLRRLYCDSLDVYMYVSWSVFVSVFYLNASTGFRQYCHWLSVYSFVSWSAFLSMFLSICLTNSACICTSLYPCFSYRIGNLHVCEQARSGVSVCNSALEYLCNIINSACIRTSIDSYFCLPLWLWMSVPVSGYVMTDCMCIYVCWSGLFFSFSLHICSSVRLYCHSMYV